MSRIAEDKIDEVRTSVNIVHYIQQFVNLKKAGQNFKGLCPFHSEKTPSFIVSPEKQIFRCFGCGKGGNIYTFIKDYEKLTFVESVHKAAEFAGIHIPQSVESEEQTGYFQKLYQINETACTFFEKNLWSGPYKKHLQYFLDRSLSEQTIKKYQLGFAPDSFDKLLAQLNLNSHSMEEAENLGLVRKRDKSNGYYDKFRYRVMFPFHNVSGKIIGFGGRKLQEEQQPKYLNSPESVIYKKGELLYGLHQAIQSIREHNSIILVEGYFDLLRLVEVGIKNVVASSGTAFSENQARLINRYTKNVHVAFDGDQAGIKAAIKASNILEKENLNAYVVALPAKEDPDTYILDKGVEAFDKLLKQSKSSIEFQIEQFYAINKSPAIEEIDAFIQDVLNQLADLPNQIKTGLYLHQLSDMFKINENILVNQLNRFRQARINQKQHQEPAETETQNLHHGMYKAEAGIIGLLLTFERDQGKSILEDITIECFENELFAQIYEHILHEIEETGKLDFNKMLDHFHDNEDIVKTITELSIAEYGDKQKFADDCIFQLKRYQMEKRTREIELLIKSDSQSADSIEHYYRELIDTKNQLQDLIKQHRTL